MQNEVSFTGGSLYKKVYKIEQIKKNKLKKEKFGYYYIHVIL